MYLTRDLFFAAGPKRSTAEVLGASVAIRGLTAGEVMTYAKLQNDNQPAKALAFVLSVGASNEAGEPLFTVDDADAIIGLSQEAPNELATAILKLSNLLKDDNAGK